MDRVATHRDLPSACVWGVRWATPVAVTENMLGLERADGGGWQLTGREAARFGLVNDYLGYLGGSELFAAHGARLRVRPAGVLPLAGGARASGLDAVTTVVLLDFLRRAGRRRCPGARRGTWCRCRGSRWTATRRRRSTIDWRRHHRVVRVSADAGPGRAESGAEGSGGAVGDRG